LADLQKLIEEKLNDKSEGVDVGYWESLLSQVLISFNVEKDWLFWKKTDIIIPA